MGLNYTKCVVAGHYPHELRGKGDENHEDSTKIKKLLRKKLKDLIEDGTTYFYCGMELGVELWAGEILLDLKKTYPDITIHSVIASEHRADDWSDEDRERYFDEVLPNCDEETYASCQNDEEAIPYRNKYLTTLADVFLIFWNGNELTDTAGLIRKATKKRKQVNIIEI